MTINSYFLTPVMLSNKKVMQRFLYYEFEGKIDSRKNYRRFFILVDYSQIKYYFPEITPSIYSEN